MKGHVLRAVMPVAPSRTAVALLFAGLVALAACGGPPSPEAPAPAASDAQPPEGAARESVLATRWVSTSGEYRALTLQAYNGASATLAEALDDPTWTASVEQAEDGGYEELPPAVILDVDETVLDNIGFQERLIELDSVYTPEIWDWWVGQAAAEVVPGAIDFTLRAAQMGVRVFYVTNRDADEEEGTRRNLVSVGLPLAGDMDALLTKGERPGWTSDKSSRRRFLARDYRILMLVGDDLGDFVSDEDMDAGARRRLVERYRDRWGERWVVLPNPVYGGWQSALNE